MIPSWAHDVKPEDITNATMLDLAELLGTENMLTLVESYSGMIIYVPKLDSLLRNIRDRRIRDRNMTERIRGRWRSNTTSAKAGSNASRRLTNAEKSEGRPAFLTAEPQNL
ncbi:MAG: hypothetical protein ACLUHE_08280 [Christensenellales bacterium]